MKNTEIININYNKLQSIDVKDCQFNKYYHSLKLASGNDFNVIMNDGKLIINVEENKNQVYFTSIISKKDGRFGPDILIKRILKITEQVIAFEYVKDIIKFYEVDDLNTFIEILSLQNATCIYVDELACVKNWKDKVYILTNLESRLVNLSGNSEYIFNQLTPKKIKFDGNYLLVQEFSKLMIFDTASRRNVETIENFQNNFTAINRYKYLLGDKLMQEKRNDIKFEEVGKIMTNVGDGILINAVNNKIDIYSTSYQSKSLFTFNYDFGNTEVSAITWKCHKNYGSLLFGEIGELVRNELKYKLIVVKVEMSMKTVKLEIDPTKIKAIIEFDYAKAVIICNDGFYMISLQ